MWYEILPSYFIIAGGLYLGAAVLPYYLNQLVIGNPYRRELRNHTQEMEYIRSMRLYDTPYYIPGNLEEMGKLLGQERPGVGPQDVPRDECPPDFGLDATKDK